MKKFKRNILYQKYIVEKKSTYQIAIELDCNATFIWHCLKKLDIPTRNKSEAQMGRCLSEKTKKKISEKHKGMKVSEEAKLKMRKNSPHLSREKHPNWKGGRFKRKDGYISIHRPNHPHSDSHGYIFEHRLVMEKTLGRYLEPHEVTHHKNEIRDDNDPNNLSLFDSKKKHLDYHYDLKKSKE